MDISCAFAPVPQTPEHIVLAEGLGYRRAWVFDTPALQLDVWMTLRARLAQLAEKGVIEIAYQPKGPDVARELTAFAAMADLGGR
jgi:5,10-methylenetetrahydromethanopterin reductase